LFQTGWQASPEKLAASTGGRSPLQVSNCAVATEGSRRFGADPRRGRPVVRRTGGASNPRSGGPAARLTRGAADRWLGGPAARLTGGSEDRRTGGLREIQTGGAADWRPARDAERSDLENGGVSA